MATKSNEKGITLVELLAALALFGVISVLIWNLFFQALNFNDRAVTQNQLQQEANIILNTIQQMHTKSTIKEIKVTDDGFLNINDCIPSDSAKFNNTAIKYQVNNITLPSKEFTLELTLTSKSNEKISFDAKTTFSKLHVKGCVN
ncbi:prepilin-type N-terminal cleavage/methylation domain-containing protein [Psychrobacillus antarcticus]|uniref:prepilin-type N-terminal cleavage/methylation domain-containing protein n=1 Tax=Psychrobacillus antarcticus TaxID=2879115 RepID=UPI002407E451|nr:prepilin-type N-terminal cleavage/methylation domain-containing protein [Psychrobacillus antarcticus]